MSASILWEPLRPGKSLGVNAPSLFMVALRYAFEADLPRVFSSSDVPVLRGMAAGMSHEAKAINKLIEAIDEFEQVRVWAEY